jgi:RecA-family ATPase
VTAYDEIEALPTVWMWEHRIPRGEVTLVAGEGGCGKGQLAVDLAARVSTGRGMPFGGTKTDPAAVIMVTPEDDLSETVAWRLRAAQADLGRVHDLTLTEHGAPFALSADSKHDGSIAQLRQAVDELGARLVVIDPLMACIAFGTIATNLGARRVIAPLQRLAKETGCAVLMTHHTVKSGAIAGSKGLLDAARVVYRVAKDRENPAIRVLSLEKSNVLGATDDVRYLLTGEGHDTRVTWLSRDEIAARRKSWREGGTQDAASELATRAARIRLGMTGRAR